MTKLGSLVLALALAATAAPALAQIPLDPLDDRSAKRLDHMEQVVRELRAIVYQGRETGKPVVVEPADTDARLTALSQKIDALQQAVTNLTGQLESASHDIDEARRDADALREQDGALTARVAALEQKLAQQAAPPPAPTAEAPPPPPADPAAAMAAARAAYRAGDDATAESGFRSVIASSGDTPRGMEARYFVGKILLKRSDFADAAAMDLAVVRGWPATAWGPNAALDLARAMVGMNERREACGVLTEIGAHYPRLRGETRTGVADVREQAGCGAP
ncbi:MAG: tol-pal system protein YbgF [Caulobacteraceae bacterium]